MVHFFVDDIRTSMKVSRVVALHLLLQRAHRLSKLKLLLLCKREKQLRKKRSYLTRQCLKHPRVSDWNYFYKTATDTNFRKVTTLNRAAFEDMVKIFRKHYKINLGQRGGRPSSLTTHHSVLGCLLSFYADTMSHKSVCLMFGITPTTCSRVLEAAEQALSPTLDEVRWPSLAEQQIIKKIIIFFIFTPILSFIIILATAISIADNI